MYNHLYILYLILILTCLGPVESQYSIQVDTAITSPQSNEQTAKQFPIKQQLKKLSDIINNGELSNIDRLINNVLTSKSIECPEMSTYVNKASQLLKNRVLANQKVQRLATSSSTSSSSPAQSTEDIKKYGQLKTMLLNLKNSLLQKNYDAEIKLRETEKNKISQDIKKYTDFCDSYLVSLREFKKNNNILSNNGKQETALLKLESQLNALQTQIKQTSQRRSSLHKNMTAIKSALLANQIAARESTSQQKLQDDYRKYSELALNASQKAKDKQQQLIRLKAQLQTKQNTPTTIDDEIDRVTKDLQQKRSGNIAKAVLIMKDANDVLKANLKNLEDRISIVESTCLVVP